MPKLCSTPGCTLKDFHNGPHSFETCLPSARCAPVSYSEVDCRTGAPPCSSLRSTLPSKDGSAVTKEDNKFQLVLDCEFMEQVMLNTAFTQKVYHEFEATRTRGGFHLTTDDSPISKSSIFYTTAMDIRVLRKFNVGTVAELASNHNDFSFEVDGNAYCKYFEERFDNNVDIEVSNAQKRMTVFSKALYQTTQFAPSDMVYTLDGDMSNRYAYEEFFYNDPTIQLETGRLPPNLITWEIDPCVALAQQLLSGQGPIRYTGADLETKFGYGVNGNLDTSPPGLEYLICNRVNSKGVENKLITKEDCENVVGLYLDYCGGPIGGTDYEGAKNLVLDTLSHLPRLCVFAITMSKRHRPGLEMDSQTYLPSIHGFALIETFTDNPKIVCWLYKRVAFVPRVLSVKWDWWKWSTRKSNTSGRQNFYKVVIRSYDTSINKYICYSVDDDANAQIFDFTTDEMSSMSIKECEFKCDALEEQGSSSSSSSSPFPFCIDNAVAMLKRKEDEVKYERLQLEVGVAKNKTEVLSAQLKDKSTKIANDYTERTSKAFKDHMDTVLKGAVGTCFEQGDYECLDEQRLGDALAFDKIMDAETFRGLVAGSVDKEEIKELKAIQSQELSARSSFDALHTEFKDVRKRIRIENRDKTQGKKRARS